MTTPTAREDPTRYDDLPPLEALRRIWSEPGPDRYEFEAMHISVRDHWPELARALDRATEAPSS